MLPELEAYYREAGILATAFHCDHVDECGAGCPEFTGPKSAFVSTGYENGMLPRLLFLSLDSGSGDKVDLNRLPQAVRQQEEVDEDVLSLEKYKHWYRTHELAWYILSHFKLGIRLDEAKSYFAHANSAKCCMNRPQRQKAKSTLFRNCQGYLSGELAILKPDIVVTRGNEARLTIHALLSGVIEQFDQFASIIELGGRRIFWLHTYHPRYWGGFNRQRNFDREAQVAMGWVKYANLIAQFIGRNA
jgi:hypothetical protein